MSSNSDEFVKALREHLTIRRELAAQVAEAKGESDHGRVEIENGPHFDYKDLVSYAQRSGVNDDHATPSK